MHFSHLCESTINIININNKNIKKATPDAIKIQTDELDNNLHTSKIISSEAKIDRKSTMATASNSLYHHTITVPSTISLRSTVPIVQRSAVSTNFNDNSSNTSNTNTNPYNHEITQILPFLYLGSQNDALSKDKMKVSVLMLKIISNRKLNLLPSRLTTLRIF